MFVLYFWGNLIVSQGCLNLCIAENSLDFWSSCFCLRCWDCRCVPPYLLYMVLGIGLRASCVLVRHSANWATSLDPSHTEKLILHFNDLILGWGGVCVVTVSGGQRTACKSVFSPTTQGPLLPCGSQDFVVAVVVWLVCFFCFYFKMFILQ